MNITRITPPKYRVGRYVLNEYELRALMLEVLKGEKPQGIKVKDIKGDTAEITSNGTLTKVLFGLDTATKFTLESIRIKRRRSEQE
jgi:hypothetical protein